MEPCIVIFILLSAGVLLTGALRLQTSSIQAYKPSIGILDYACTKGAIVAFTKGLGMDLFPRHGIRVNTVAPGPVWCACNPYLGAVWSFLVCRVVCLEWVH